MLGRLNRPCAGLVLCGGASSRMGIDKATLLFDGVPLWLRVAQRLARAADPVRLAPGTPGRLGQLEYKEVADAMAGAGPLAGLLAGLRSSPHDLLAVVAVDMPHVSPEVMALLVAYHGDDDALVPRAERGLEPLHAVYARSALTGLEAALAARELSLQTALRRLRVREVGPEEWRDADPLGRFATNLNQ